MTERGGIVISWFAKILVTLAIAGVLLFEAAAIVVANVNADTAARAAAKESVATFADTHDTKKARAEADRLAGHEGATVVEFVADAAGVGGQERVSVTVEKRAKTLFAHKIGFLKRFVNARASARAFAV